MPSLICHDADMQTRTLRLISVAFGLLIIGWFGFAGLRNELAKRQFEALPLKTAQLGQCQFDLSLAKSTSEQRRGLSLLPVLADDRGLAFPQATAGRPNFWMHQMRFNIDLIWLNQERVVAVDPNLTLDGGRRIYPAPQPVDLIIELAAGRAEECQIKPDSPLLYPS